MKTIFFNQISGARSWLRAAAICFLLAAGAFNAAAVNWSGSITLTDDVYENIVLTGDVTLTVNDNWDIYGNITGNGYSLTVNGTGRLILNGTLSNISGITKNGNGWLYINGNVNNVQAVTLGPTADELRFQGVGTSVI